MLLKVLENLQTELNALARLTEQDARNASDETEAQLLSCKAEAFTAISEAVTDATRFAALDVVNGLSPNSLEGG